MIKFTSKDIHNFIDLFLVILEEEFRECKKFWKNKFQELSFEKKECERYLSDRLSDYQNIFRYFGKDAEGYLSFSLACNGRGIYSDDKFSAVIPYPSIPQEREDYFFNFFMSTRIKLPMDY